MKTSSLVNILFLVALSATLLYLFKILGFILSLILFLSFYSYSRGRENLGALSSSLTYVATTVYALTSNLDSETVLLLLAQIALFDSLSSLLSKIGEEVERHRRESVIRYVKEYMRIVVETLAFLALTFSMLWIPLSTPSFYEATLLAAFLAFFLILLFKLHD